MPELPEVQTTVNGLNRTVKGHRIAAVSTSYKSSHHTGKDNIKDPKFFPFFKRKVEGARILKAERRAKNVLIHLSNKYTIIVHMKMTGHFVYDRPNYPFTRLDFELDNGKNLSLSDMRKFAKVTIVKTSDVEKCIHLQHLGPEPLDKNFQFKIFNFQLQKRSKVKIKQVLMDQSLIAGIGNIYSDEILWRAGVHPLSRPNKIPPRQTRLIFKATKELLQKGIQLGGDSMSDYRNIKGEKGKFQEHHRAYRRTGKTCGKPYCKGVISRIVVNSRSAHFCPVHQKLFK
ncbi:MAG: DNA-formamidopyrimidine glycosylase [Candidatus Zambryskibacteria bacterium]|nr:DNA-formamidopyrimidine glycosylase [Candidatus Zambryskibacteria bacterium]